jgi:signal transduction histidine kinase
MRRALALSLAAAAAVAVTLILAFHADDALELPLRDAALRRLPSHAAQSVVVVAIDEKSIRQLGRWPWPRTRLAEIVDRAADFGARGVVLDLLLPENQPDDTRLADATRRVPTLTVAVIVERGQWLLPSPAIRKTTTQVHGNFERDGDGILRRFASTKQNRDLSLTALPVEAASVLKPMAIPVGRSIAPMFRARPQAVPIISAADLLTRKIDVRDKLVFIGPTAMGLGDRVLTPVSGAVPDPGVTVHAAATESILRGEILREVPPVVGGLLAGVAVAILLLNRESRRVRLVLAALLVASIAAGGFVLLQSNGVAIPFVALAIAIVITAAGLELIASAQMEQRFAVWWSERRAQDIESKRVLAHELKTPLASMRGLSQLLSGFELNEAERRRVASLLETEAGKLQTMVTALLDLERLPLRDFDTSSSVTDLGALVAARIEFLRASTDRTLMTAITPGVQVRGDATLIERVVDNLVGNALKYSPQASPVTISVRQNNGHALLQVEDRGPGIAPDERNRIFERFFRGSTAAGTQGLGLGLSLVSEVANWHGGSVSIHEANGGGSLFQVTLPGAM